jgi:hypothetical protein
LGSAAQEGLARGSENRDQCAERESQQGAATDANAVELAFSLSAPDGPPWINLISLGQFFPSIARKSLILLWWRRGELN